jgi:hypothetical protein
LQALEARRKDLAAVICVACWRSAGRGGNLVRKAAQRQDCVGVG